MTAKRFIQLLVSLIIGGAGLWFAFKNVPLDETRTELMGVAWWGHAGFVALVFAQFIVRSERWALQVTGVSGKRVRRREALAINAVSFASVFLFPFRLGEFVRPVLSQKRGLMSRSAGLALSAVERVVDGLITTAFFGIVLVTLDDVELPDTVRVGGLFALLVFGGASVVLIAAARTFDASIRFWRRALNMIHPKLADVAVGILERFVDGLRCFKTRGALASYLGLSLLFWAMNGLSIYVLLRGMGQEISPFVAYFSLCFLVIGVMIPAPPGNLGNFHYFAKLSLVLVGVPAVPALAFAVLTHGWQVISLVVWAGAFLLSGDVSFARLKEAALTDDGARGAHVDQARGTDDTRGASSAELSTSTTSGPT